MQRPKKQLGLGLRWLTCGRRLLSRNPWLLGGMGLTWAALMSLLSVIPILGTLLIAFLVPLIAASTYLAIDNVSRQKAPLPAPLRMTAVKQSPQGLVGIFANEEGTISAVVAGVCSLVVALVVNTGAQVLGGGAWSSEWAGLDLIGWGRLLATGGGMVAVYGLLGAALVFALPLTLLQDEPFFPALGRSLKASARHAFALLVIAAVVLVPFVLGAVVGVVSPWAKYLAWIAAGTVAFPLAATSAYCSYRTVFPTNGEHQRH